MKKTFYMVAGLAVAAAMVGCSSDNTSPVGGGIPVGTSTTQAPPPVNNITYHQPTVTDFVLTVRILKKQCFGAAGCNIQYRIDMVYGGPALDPGKTYEITYEVRGGEDVKINTLRVTGDQYERDEIEFGGAKNSTAELTAVVISVNM